jgi:hypothetical protein
MGSSLLVKRHVPSLAAARFCESLFLFHDSASSPLTETSESEALDADSASLIKPVINRATSVMNTMMLALKSLTLVKGRVPHRVEPDELVAGGVQTGSA